MMVTSSVPQALLKTVKRIKLHTFRMNHDRICWNRWGHDKTDKTWTDPFRISVVTWDITRYNWRSDLSLIKLIECVWNTSSSCSHFSTFHYSQLAIGPLKANHLQYSPILEIKWHASKRISIVVNCVWYLALRHQSMVSKKGFDGLENVRPV